MDAPALLPAWLSPVKDEPDEQRPTQKAAQQQSSEIALPTSITIVKPTAPPLSPSSQPPTNQNSKVSQAKPSHQTKQPSIAPTPYLRPARNLSTASSRQIPVRRRLHLLSMPDRRVIAANALETPVTRR